MAEQWKGWKLEGLAQFVPAAHDRKQLLQAQGTRRVLVTRARVKARELSAYRKWISRNPKNARLVAKCDREIDGLDIALNALAEIADPEWFLARRKAAQKDALAVLLAVDERREAA